MKCCICQKDISQVGALFRINAKGQPGVWACREHRGQTDAPIDPELDEIVGIIASATSA